MLTDRYGLELSTTSAAAQDAYVQGGKAQVLMRQEYAMRLWQ